MRWILVIFFALSPGLSRAEQTPWVCEVDLSLIGDGMFFYLRGTDAWKGRAPFTCIGNKGSRTGTIEVSFKSDTGNVGANDSSIVKLRLSFVTFAAPDEFQVRSLVRRNNDSPLLTWEFASQLTSGYAAVLSPTPPNLRAALSEGKLWIRTTVQSAQW